MNPYRNIFEPPPLTEETEVDWQDVLTGFLGSMLFLAGFCIMMFNCHLLVYAAQHQFDKDQMRDHLQDIADKVTP